MTHLINLTLSFFLLAPCIAVGQTQASVAIEQQTLYEKGTDGYHTYRIPSLITTPNGTVLAFCEGRKSGRGDTGDIDLLVKRSTDHGATWSKQQVVWDDSTHVCGNPCPVVDTATGTIYLLMTWNRGDDHEAEIIHKTSQDTRRVFVTKSTDEGKTWSQPGDITPTTKLPEWGWYATGPGTGIQIQHGPYQGRLVIPANHSYDDPEGEQRGGPFEYGAHVIYSDDQGQTWELGGVIRPKMNESQVFEVADGEGTLVMNMRSYFGRNRRAHAVSKDGGESWSAPEDVSDLIEPVCQASVARYSWPRQGQKSILVFSNPAATSRVNMTVKLSYDEGESWPVRRTLYEGPSAYSSLTVLPNGQLGCLYERGEENPYENITLALFPLAWVQNEGE